MSRNTNSLCGDRHGERKLQILSICICSLYVLVLKIPPLYQFINDNEHKPAVIVEAHEKSFHSSDEYQCCSFFLTKVMAGTNHGSGRDVFRGHKSSNKDYSHRGDHASHDTKDRNQTPRDLDKRGSAGDRRVRQNRQRDASDMETPGHRGHYPEGPLRG